MRTLFIHPTDPSTEFLNLVYDRHRDNPDVTIIEDCPLSHRLIKEGLKNNDRIVFLGHGNEYGLLDLVSQRQVISSRDLTMFREKEVICYWCNANIFAERYDLHAFSTGMFVSELREARWYELPEDQNLIDQSNTLFCNILADCVFDDLNTIRTRIENEYVDPNNPIIIFNRECMGFKN